MVSTVDAGTALNDLAAAILAGWGGDQTFSDAWGWNCPPLTRHDLAKSITDIAADLMSLSPEHVSPDLSTNLAFIPARVASFRNTTLNQLYGGNNGAAVQVLYNFLGWVKALLPSPPPPMLDWTSIESQQLVPVSLARRLRSLEAHLTNLTARAGTLDEKIALIQSAYSAAESLPTDLETLRDAREEVAKTVRLAESDRAKVELSLQGVIREFGIITAKRDESVKLVENCEDAYSAATTKGLGEAFSLKAAQLSRSMWIWVSGLIMALSVGTLIGHDRVSSLQQAISASTPNSAAIFANLIMTALSVAAPVWFAWVATKQIGQRFRLSEDYGYKASVAKAYAGYRRKAARLDPEFAARLFGSALSRIEEPPLRLVENESHGSPFHEIADKFKKINFRGGGVEIAATKTDSDVSLSPQSGSLASKVD